MMLINISNDVSLKDSCVEDVTDLFLAEIERDNLPFYQILKELAYSEGRAELAKILMNPEEQERIRFYYARRVAKRKKYLDYAKRDLDDYEKLVKRICQETLDRGGKSLCS